jgi:hypothetical protein
MAITDPAIGNATSSKTSGTTLSVPNVGGGADMAVDDLIVVLFSMDNAAGTVSCTDGLSAIYTSVSDVTNAAGVRSVILWAKALGNRAATGAVTVTHPSVTARAMNVRVFRGQDLTSPFDQQNTGTTNGSTATTSNSVTPGQDGELVIAVTGVEDTNNEGNPTQPAWVTDALNKVGTTGGGAASNIYSAGGFEIQTTATARTYNPTLTGAADSANCIVTFMPAVAAEARVPRSTPYPQLLAH